jgi:exopolysaccharide biosynthesis polyprenyl glycosylphosphotransferase
MSSLHALPRKRPGSMKTAAAVYAGGIKEQLLAKPQPSFLSHVAQTLLPRPWAATQQWSFWRAVSCDFLLIASVFVLVARFNGQSFFQWRLLDMNPRSSVEPRLFLGFGLIYGALITLLGYSEGLYQERSHAIREEIPCVFKSVWLGTLIIGVAMRVVTTESWPLAALLWSASLSISALLGWRAWNHHVAAKNVEMRKGVRNVLIVGGGTRARELAAHLEANPQMRRVVKGFIDEWLPLGGEILGRIDDLPDIARAEFIDEVILMPEAEDDARRLIRQARQQRLDLLLVPDLFGSELEQPRIGWLAHLPVIALHEERLPEFALFIKRTVDLLLSMILLAVLSLPMSVIALLIKLESRGPLLYRAPRAGRKGQRFSCYKFRTMVNDADQLKEGLRRLNQRQGPCFKITQDPRITRVGRFLRRYSLDELPQLWNVLRGEMSLVGPRPHPLDDVSRYELAHLRRLDVTPGITGLWQVTARQDPSFVTALALDLKYIEEWSVWLDLRILFKTFSAVLTGTGV